MPNKDIFLDNLRETVNKYNMIKSNDIVLCGLSGGSDSVALLLLLKKYFEAEKNLSEGNLFAVHVNHGIRGAEAQRDTDFCIDLCKRLGVELIVKYVDVPKVAKEKKLSIETCARDLRYAEFYNVSKELLLKNNAEDFKIAVAHNLDDKCETIFFNIARGTGLQGLKGISPINGNVIRPIINLTKKQTIEVCAAYSEKFIIDSTNLENDASRNIIRNIIFPKIREELNVDINSSLLSLSELSDIDVDFISGEENRAYISCVSAENNRLYVKLNLFQDFHRAVKSRIIIKALSDVSKDGIKPFEYGNGINKRMIDNTLDFLANGNGNIEIGRNVIIKKQDNFGIIEIAAISKSPENFEYNSEKILLFDALKENFPWEKTVLLKNNTYKVTAEIIYGGNFKSRLSKNSVVLDFDELKKDYIENCNIYLRTPMQGDCFTSFGSGGSKPLRRVLTNEKIPIDKRNEQPLIATEDKILSILNVKGSNFYTIQKSTKCVILVKVILQ